MAKTHQLKTWPEPFTAVVNGIKRFEFRRDDRGFQVGDTLQLEEWDPAPFSRSSGTWSRGYTGNKVSTRVTYIVHGTKFGIPSGFCCMSIVRMNENPEPKTQGGE